MTQSPRFTWRTLGAVLLATPLLWLPCVAAISQPAAFAQGKSSTGQQIPPNPIEVAEQNGTALHLSLRDLTKLALQNNLDIAYTLLEANDFEVAMTESGATQKP